MLKKYAKKSKPRNKTRKIKGGILSNYEAVFKNPSWQRGSRQWATLVKIDGLEVYGSSIPHQNIHKCLATFQFYMHVKNIKRIISLQGCDVEDGVSTDNCQGFLYPNKTKIDKKYESRIWNALKEVSLLHSEDTNIEFVNHKIVDMTAGNLTEWRVLYNYDYKNKDQITLIHCLAGFGRTGSILFLIWLKQYYENPDITENVSTPYLGYSNGSIMITTLTLLFNRVLFLDDDTNNGICNEDIKSFDPKLIMEELTNIRDRDGKVSLHLVNLLIVRMNYIRICLGIGFKVTKIFLYPKKSNSNINFDGIFLNPQEIDISDLDGILQNPTNIYGIRK